jgi:hypothetical protein
MRRYVAGLAVALTLALALSTGCGEVVAQAIGGSPDGGSDATSDRGSDGPPGDDGTSSADSPVDATGFCQGKGAVLPGTNPHLCAGDLANLFKFAACACTSFDVSGVLTTASLASSDGGLTEVASVGANQALSANSTTTIGGSVWSAGAGLAQGASAVLLGGTAPGLVAGDIQSGGPVEIAGPYLVMGDVWANGNVIVDPSGSLQVDGTVHVPPADTVSMDVDAGGGIAHPAAVTVAPPCDCANSIDVANIVQGFQTTNDDAANQLTPSSLDNPTHTIPLPCGLYYFDGIHGSSAVSLDVQGRVAVFVGGDLSVTQGITIELEPGAELDLFIAGNVDIEGPSGSVTVGDVSHAALTRIYVGGNGNDAGGGFTLSADATLSANIYAPNAVVQLASDFVLRGAILAGALQFSGDFSILYDTAVLQVSQSSGCQPTGGGCATCNDCPSATPACNGGTCGPCQTTADCCAPLVCVTGTGLCELPTQ